MSNSINNPENEEKHLYDPVDYNPHIGLATIDHAGPFAGFGTVRTLSLIHISEPTRPY